MRTIRIAIALVGFLGGSFALAGTPAAPESSPAPAPASAPAPAPAAADTSAAAPPAAVAAQDAPSATNPAPAPEKDASAPREATARAETKAGKPKDTLELDTTDITGNRELPKVMYIVPWKHSDLGDLTGKPLNSLVDEVLQPVDRDVFKRENRYYGAVAGTSTTSDPAAPAAAAHTGGNGSGAAQASAARDER